jgi:hypothetical protein
MSRQAVRAGAVFDIAWHAVWQGEQFVSTHISLARKRVIWLHPATADADH